MARRRNPEDLTVEELRQLLIDKRRSERKKRIDHYRRTGRVILVDTTPIPPSPLDSLLDEPYLAEDASQPRGTRLFFDRLLFLIEVAAVLGLGFVIWSGISVMRNLNQEVAQVLVQPTLTPTPIISAVVLPSGHTPPENGETHPNEAEIPEHLRPLVQSMSAAMVAPTPSPQHAVNVKIPALDIFAPVVQGDAWEQLKKGVGQHAGTVSPGENGNLVLSAHNDVYGELFRYLDKLNPGDEVILYTQQHAYTYVVRQTQLVEPTQVEVMLPSNEPIVTLISCYPYMVDNQRIVVTAYLVNNN